MDSYEIKKSCNGCNYTHECTQTRNKVLPRDEPSRQKMHCLKMQHLGSTLHMYNTKQYTVYKLGTHTKICPAMSHLNRKCTAERCGILTVHYIYLTGHMYRAVKYMTETAGKVLTFNFFLGIWDENWSFRWSTR